MIDNAQLSEIVALAIGDYAPIRATYKYSIASTIQEYLYSENVKVTRFKSQFKRAISESFYPAFDQGYVDGGSELPIEPDDTDYVNSRVDGEYGFVDTLFQQLRDLKKQVAEEGTGILQGVAESRAEGYARTLDGIYSQGKVRGGKNKMLTFGGTDGKESCKTCQKLKSQRHKASWWKNHGLILYRGNDRYECGVYECQHYLYDDEGHVYTF